MRAANSARSYAARSLSDTDLTLTQFAVLEALYHLGPMSLSDIARKVLTTGGNLTMVVGNLEKLGLAKRQSCPEDRRVLIVVLTAKGKTLLQRCLPQTCRRDCGIPERSEYRRTGAPGRSLPEAGKAIEGLRLKEWSPAILPLRTSSYRSRIPRLKLLESNPQISRASPRNLRLP